MDRKAVPAVFSGEKVFQKRKPLDMAEFKYFGNRKDKVGAEIILKISDFLKVN